MNHKTRNRLTRVRQALRKGDSSQALPLLQELLGSEEASARRYAAETIGELGVAGLNAVPSLVQKFTDTDPSVRKSAVRALGGIGQGPGRDRVMPILLEALEHDDSNIRSEALWALLALGPEAISAFPQILKALQDQVFWVKLSAIQVLGKMVGPGDEQEEAISALNQALKDDDSEVRKEAAVALEKIKKREEEMASFTPIESSVLQELLDGLKSSDANRRMQSAERIGDHGPSALPAVPNLILALQDIDKDVRSAAADSLGDIGPHAREAIPALQRAIRDTHKDVRDAATEALRYIRNT